MANEKHFLISRTDSIGDVVLTLPMCAAIRKKYPHAKISFLARTYTVPVVRMCEHVDDIINWDEMISMSPSDQIALLQEKNIDVIVHVFPRKEIIWLAKRARIPLRIATGRRWYTLMKCNKLVFFSRKKSNLHEAQLNMKLLAPLDIQQDYSLKDIAGMYGLTKYPTLPERLANLIDRSKKNIILHPKSRGSAVEWPLESWKELIESFEGENVHVYITGTAEEKKWVHERIQWPEKSYVTDLSGTMSLDELCAFIASCDVLIAASTGPLHIASALGKRAIGLYSPKRPIHPGRWAPIGINAQFLVAKEHPSTGGALQISVHDLISVL
jgi:heptosyltransferase-3